MIMNVYHPSLPQVSVQRCASTACRKPGERCDPGSGRMSKAKPDWPLRMPWATPRGRRGRRRHPSSKQKTVFFLSLQSKQHAKSSGQCDNLCKSSHHLPNNDGFWSQLFVDGEDVNETECEDHEVHTKDLPAEFVWPPEHSKHRTKEMYYGNSTTQWNASKITALWRVSAHYKANFHSIRHSKGHYINLSTPYYIIT